MIFAVLGSLGGIVAFIGGVVVIVRAVFRNIGAVEDNTTATRALAAQMNELQHTASDHGERIARLEGWHSGRASRQN